MSLAKFLREVVEIPEDSGVPHMLTGSLASAYYAVPRATQDVDLVIDTDQVALDRVVVGLASAGYYVDQGAAQEALESHGQFNAVDPVGGWKVDLIIKKDRSFSRTEFDRRASLGSRSRSPRRVEGRERAGRFPVQARRYLITYQQSHHQFSLRRAELTP